MRYTCVHQSAQQVIGVPLRTAYKTAAKDIPPFWESFLSDRIVDRIPNKKSDAIMAVYTDYESDYKGAYTLIIGLPVLCLTEIPDGMVGITIPEGKFSHIEVKGDVKTAIPEAWQSIWDDEKLEEQRAYTFDYEVYDERAVDPNNAIVDIFLALKS